jgi:hypothetical protein
MAGVPGFDSSAFPGLLTMSWLKTNTNFQWCGFYLGPAPSHPDKGWMSQRAALVQQGWGFAPLYVGQQVVGPGSKQSSGPQGVTDGNNAAALMAAAGFPNGSFVYIDLENGPPLQPKQQAYLTAWVNTVEAGGFGPGIYCSHGFAMQVHTLCPTARIWAFNVPTTAVHTIPGVNFPDSHPAGSGFTGAFIWQLAQNGVIGALPPNTLEVDLNTALAADPSQPNALT